MSEQTAGISKGSNLFPGGEMIQSTAVRNKHLSGSERLPLSSIPSLPNPNGIPLDNRRNSSDSTSDYNDSEQNLDDDTYIDNSMGADGGFVEFQLDQPGWKKKAQIKEIDHDFHKIKQNYENARTFEKQEQDTELSSQLDSEKSEPSDGKDKDTDKDKDRNDDDDEDDDYMDEWKEIDTQLNYGDVYNIKGEKVDFFHSQDELTNQNSVANVEKYKKKKSSSQKIASTSLNVAKRAVQITAGVKIGQDEKERELREKYQRAHLINTDNTKQGYTRIDEENQARKFNEMDKKFDFLFQNENSNLRKLHNASSTSFSSSVDNLSKVTDDFMRGDKFDEIFDQEGRDDNELNSSMQVMSTKNMLNDPQKIAYAALVKLIIVHLNTALINVRGSNSTKILKKLAISHTSFMRWSMEVMNSLYQHLDIKNEGEIKMIETLSCHGLEYSDLAKTFDKNVTIENHLKDGENHDDDLKLINVNKTELVDDQTIEIDIKWTLICDLFLILLESSVYDSRSRTLLIHFAQSIGITKLEVYQFERRITDSLEVDEAFEIINNNQTWNESDILKEHKKKQRNSKIIKIALATAAGGLVIGLSAGALAPVIGAGLAAGLTTIGIGGTGGFLAGAGGTAIIATGGVMSGMRAGKNAMSHRVGSVKTFEFIPLHNNRRVNLIITVSGWMSGEMDDVRLPFSTVDQVMGDLYSLLWEPEMLTSMGQTINILANEILTQSIQQILGSTLLITLMAGLQLPMMLSKLGYLLDNPWNNSLDRAWRSGKVLADTLRRNKLGVRPITLVGFSLGARLIYSCLLHLAKSGDYGIVENVFLFGSPTVMHDDEMAQARSVVSGRFVNGYMKQDWILGYLFRATSGGLRSIAGLSPVDEERFNVENFNCQEHVKGHMQYREAMPKLLKEVGWEVLEDQFVEIEQPNPGEEERQRKLLGDFEKAQHSKKKKSWYSKVFGRKNKEWWEMYEEGEKEKQKEKEKKKKIKQNEKNANGSDDDGSISEEESIADADFDIEALKREIANIQKEAKKMEAKKSYKLTKVKTEKNVKDNEHENENVNSSRKSVESETNNERTSQTVSSNLDEPRTPDFKRVHDDHAFKTESTSTSSNTGNASSPVKDTDFTHPNFHLSPVKSVNDKPVVFEPKKIRKRTSLIQLVESKETDSNATNRGDPRGNGELKQFRITSTSSTHGHESRKPSFNKSPAMNLNMFQPISNVSPNFGENDLHPGKQDEILPVVEKHSQNVVAEQKSIDYGEYDTPQEEHLEIMFDDDIDKIESEIREQQKSKSGYGPATGIDYGDEDEFPQDESHVQFSFE
jgi:hypothetical protein